MSVIPVSLFTILSFSNKLIHILVTVTEPMRERGLVNWPSAICGATEELCTIFREGPTIFIQPRIAEEALAESIFNCVKRSPNYHWVPEDGGFWNSDHQFYVLSLATVEWPENLRTTFNNSKFKALVMKELCETPARVSLYLWNRAKYLIQNQTGFNGQFPHNNGIISNNSPVDANLVDWWCTWSDDYGYGIFHQGQWDPVLSKYTLVSLNIIGTVIITNYDFAQFSFLGYSI